MMGRVAIPQTVSPITRALFGPGARLPERAAAYAPFFRRHGIAVMPLPYGEKEPFAHCPTRLFFETPLANDDISIAFEGQVNIAVIVGRISGNLAVLDAETLAQFGVFLEIFRRAYIPLCAVQTGRGGHVYFRCADGELANIRKRPDDKQEWELWGNRHYCVTAPSVHPDGPIYTVVEWAEEGTEIPALTLAELRALLPDIPFSLAHRQARPLTPETQEFLAGRTPEGRRNDQLLTTTHELLGRGMALPDVELQIVGAAIATGLSRREAINTFWSAVKGHKHEGGKVNTNTAPRLWQKAQAWAEAQAWPGRTGMTKRAIFLAHVGRCRMDAPGATERAVWRATERELAELAHISRKTARNATRGLVTDDFLAIAQRDHVEGNRYAFGRITESAISTPLLQCSYRGVVLSLSDGDSFERGGLPKSAAPVLRVLSEARSPLRLCDVYRTSGLTKRQGRYALQRLVALGLVVKSGSHFELRVSAAELPDALEDLAFQTGTAGAGEARRRGHIRERQARLLDIILKARQKALQPAQRKGGQDDAGSV